MHPGLFFCVYVENRSTSYTLDPDLAIPAVCTLEFFSRLFNVPGRHERPYWFVGIGHGLLPLRRYRGNQLISAVVCLWLGHARAHRYPIQTRRYITGPPSSACNFGCSFPFGQFNVLPRTTTEAQANSITPNPPSVYSNGSAEADPGRMPYTKAFRPSTSTTPSPA